MTLARKYGVADSTEGRLRVELFDPAEGGSIKDLIFESRDFDLAGTAASYSFREDNIQAHLEDGQYFGFWAGNVETIPAEPETLPDYFFSGPTPTTELRVVDDVPVYTDPRTIKVPLWVFGNEVDVSASRTIARIHSAQAEGRPVLLYAVDESFGWEVLELENSAESGQSLDRQIVMWLPWGNSAGAVGTWTGDVTADIIFRMLAVYTVTR